MSTRHALSGSVPDDYNRYLVPMIFEDDARSLAERVDRHHEILERTEDVDAIVDGVTETVAARYGETDCESSMQALLVTAHAPS